MSQKVKIILDNRDTHGSEVRGRFKAKQVIRDQYGKDMQLIDEHPGPEENEITYSFVRKQMQQPVSVEDRVDMWLSGFKEAGNDE